MAPLSLSLKKKKKKKNDHENYLLKLHVLGSCFIWFFFDVTWIKEKFCILEKMFHLVTSHWLSIFPPDNFIPVRFFTADVSINNPPAAQAKGPHYPSWRPRSGPSPSPQLGFLFPPNRFNVTLALSQVSHDLSSSEYLWHNPPQPPPSSFSSSLPPSLPPGQTIWTSSICISKDFLEKALQKELHQGFLLSYRKLPPPPPLPRFFLFFFNVHQ